MFTKSLIVIIFNIFFYQQVSTQSCDLEDFYSHFFGQLESVKKSVEILNTRLDIITDRHSAFMFKSQTTDENVETSANISKPIFDIRYDDMPKHCAKHITASSCVEATQCTRSSGIYNITVKRYSNESLNVFCDTHNFAGDWLYILKRVDGSENFNRPWLDYVKGFGNVAGEYWIGLEHLHALTNYNGPQELNIYMENFEGRQVFARYDNFVVGNASENYKLKSLGRYWGTAGDSLFKQLGAQFSTHDFDNDELKDTNCAAARKGGFWFKDCSKANPMGRYLRGKYTNLYEGSYWRTFDGENYSQKTIIYMIRRQTIVNYL
ncbi:angiopoietin-related protein 2-like [Calliphora vicina]|uniref:angiopoietin-related protein 2-like n=1 Tax=Calliphora vicina TaxID=7373 RepID=UPI00325B7047